MWAVPCAVPSRGTKERSGKFPQKFITRSVAEDGLRGMAFRDHAACAAAGQPPCHLGKRRSAAWEGRKAHCFFESMPSDSSKTPLYSIFWMKILNSAH